MLCNGIFYTLNSIICNHSMSSLLEINLSYLCLFYAIILYLILLYIIESYLIFAYLEISRFELIQFVINLKLNILGGTFTY